MLAIIKTEFYKIKRYHILLIGILGMLCSPLLQLFRRRPWMNNTRGLILTLRL